MVCAEVCKNAGTIAFETAEYNSVSRYAFVIKHGVCLDVRSASGRPVEAHTGLRKNAIMQGFATTLTKTDIENLAAYYAAQPAVLSAKY